MPLVCYTIPEISRSNHEPSIERPAPIPIRSRRFGWRSAPGSGNPAFSRARRLGWASLPPVIAATFSGTPPRQARKPGVILSRPIRASQYGRQHRGKRYRDTLMPLAPLPPPASCDALDPGGLNRKSRTKTSRSRPSRDRRPTRLEMNRKYSSEAPACS